MKSGAVFVMGLDDLGMMDVGRHHSVEGVKIYTVRYRVGYLKEEIQNKARSLQRASR